MRSLPLLGLLAVPCSLHLVTPAAGQTLEPCPPPYDGRWECGSIRVPENRQTGVGRTIDIVFKVRRAAGPDVREPIFALSGGPGQPTATGVNPNRMASQAERRDAVFVDQRGTGRSNGFNCEMDVLDDPHLVYGQLYPLDPVRRCFGRYRVESDPDQYTTGDFADDLDAVREFLGYDRVVLSGGSYGTRSAITYAAMYPDRVAGLILNGVMPPHEYAPLAYARSAHDALYRMFDDCRAQRACDRAYPRLEARFEAAMEELRSAPREATIRTSNGRRVTVRMRAPDLGYALRITLYNRNRIPALPRVLHDALETGDLSRLAQALYDRASGMYSAVSMGLHFSVFCAEDLPFIEEREVGPAIEGTYFGRYFIDQYREGCRAWPVERRDRRSHEVPILDVPVLMLSGRYDPVTPPHFAESTRRYFPNSVHLVMGNGGHGAGGPCITRMIDAFLSRLDLRDVTDRCDAVRMAEFGS